jgi:MOSC domain-containing protein YiiM
MKVVSLNIGLPREIQWQGEKVTTGIFKESVKGPVMLRTLNLDGDRQADLSVHGGISKAVYAYPGEHYEFWKKELPDLTLPHGMFGENFTTEGLFEDTINLGDRFRRCGNNGHRATHALLQARPEVWSQRYTETISG